MLPASWLVFVVNIIIVNARVDLYKGVSTSSHDCNVDIAEPFSCICLHSGLWKIYSSCLEFTYLSVSNKHCFSPREMIRRIEMISKPNAKLSLISQERQTEFDSTSGMVVERGDILVTKGSLTVNDGLGPTCLDQSRQQGKDVYCMYDVNDLRFISDVQEGCEEGTPKILPFECQEAVKDVQECPASFETTNDLGDLTRQKRMLPPHAVEKNPLADNTDPDDEDFYDPNAPAPYGPEVPADAFEGKTTENPIIVAEIWNYLDQQLDEVLGLGNPTAPPASMQDIPVFKILEASKLVMLKTCPAFYVAPEFIDLTVDTFAAVLMKRNYLREFNTEYAGLHRIIDALEKCAHNATAFPFIDESAHDECEKGSVKTNPGAYEKFENKSELVVHESMESYEYDPIIDVVWKIFVNSYLTCFHWFEPKHNDIFRYATIMEALFQGEIFDLWMEGKTQGKMLGGFLGNMKEITQYVTLCTASSGLETTFPWSLNRPAKISEAEKKRIKRHAQMAGFYDSDNVGASCATSQQCIDFV